jgi:hypothetical protein
MNALEAFANASVGFAVSWAATYWLLPLWGFAPGAGQALSITATFFFLSFARAWALRLAFKRWAA